MKTITVNAIFLPALLRNCFDALAEKGDARQIGLVRSLLSEIGERSVSILEESEVTFEQCELSGSWAGCVEIAITEAA